MLDRARTRWEDDESQMLKDMVAEHRAETGGTIKDACRELADMFGRTVNALECRHWKITRGAHHHEELPAEDVAMPVLADSSDEVAPIDADGSMVHPVIDRIQSGLDLIDQGLELADKGWDMINAAVRDLEKIDSDVEVILRWAKDVGKIMALQTTKGAM